ERQRQQQRHAGERPKPGQDTDHGAPKAADEAVEQPLPGQRDREAADEVVEAAHLRTDPPGAARRAAPRTDTSTPPCRARSRWRRARATAARQTPAAPR